MKNRMLLLAVAALGPFAACADPIAIKGKLDEVTVYRGQALVTRALDLPAQQGVVELLVTDLPQRIVPGSLFAEGGESVQVRSVVFRTRAVSDDVREDVKKIDDQLAALNDSLNAVRKNVEVLQKNAETLAKVEQFTATVGSGDLSRGVLNADTLQKLTQFIFEQRATLSKAMLDSERAAGKLQQDIDLTQRKRNEITAGASKVAREALVLVDAKNPNAKLRLNYLVDQASWEPSYTIHGKKAGGDVMVNYQAAISQMTGEDWDNVKMNISTATPSVVSSAPTLEPLELTLQRLDPATAAVQLRNNEELARAITQRKAQAEQLYINNGGNFQVPQQQAGQGQQVQQNLNYAQRDNIYAANRVADEVQMFEFNVKDKASIRALNKPDQSVTVSYQLANRTTLSSRSDRQLVGIASLSMKGEYYRLATPVLTSYVYREAAVVNGSNTVLLDGPSMSYLDGEFVGHGLVPMTGVGGNFVVGFGIDTSLRATRELVERAEQTQGGNAIVTFDYRLNIENFGEDETTVRVIDRIPKPDGNQLKPTLVSTSQDLSKNEDYQRTQRKVGLLRWDIAVKPHTTGSKATTVEYRMTLEHDRQMTVAGMAAK